MSTPPTESNPPLRRHAEDKLALSGATNLETPTTTDTQKLLHELQVHQIELEMQNDELRQAIAERDEQNARMATLMATYNDLYDFAPAGYFTLAHDGIIHSTNLTGAKLLGVERSRLINQRLDAFISDETRAAFHDFLGKVFACEVKLACEVAFITAHHSQLTVQIEAVVTESRKHCHAVMIDITARKQAEQALAKANLRLEALMSAVPVGVSFSDDITCQRITGNPAVLEQFNVSVAENLSASALDTDAPGRKVKFFLDGREITNAELPLQRAVSENKVIPPMELEVVMPNGRHWFAKASGAPVRDAQGNIICGIALTEDITALKHAVAIQQESDVRLRFHVDNSPMAVIEWDQNFVVKRWSGASARMFGWSADEVVGKPYTELRMVFEDDIPIVENTIAQLTAVNPRQVVAINRNYTKSGDIRYCTWYNSVMLDKDGRMSSVLSNVIDITELKLSQEALGQSQKSLVELIERSPFGTYIVDSQFRIAMMNSSSQTGAFRNVHPVIGRDFAEAMHILWPENIAAEIIGNFRHTLDTGEAYYSRDFINPRHDTELVESYEWELHRIALQDGQNGVICYYYDSTQLRQAEAALRKSEKRLREQAEQLRENDRRKDEFLSMLAHELRNPMAPIRNAAEILKRTDFEPDRIAWCSQIIERQTAHLVAIVDDLLDVSRLSRGLIELNKESFQIRDVIFPAIESCRPLIDANRHEFCLELPPEPLWIEADRIRLTQVVVNLLNNAAKYTEEGGRINLSVELCGETFCIRVKDNGQGIDSADLRHLFDLFFQTDRTLDRSQGGLGIGLFLVQKIVEMHGGIVQAFSAGRDQGSEFIVRLHRHVLPKLEAVCMAALTAPPQKKLRILLVDDNRDAAESLAMVLEFDGHQVLTAYDGPAALELAQAERPDVILLDIGLPTMNGYLVAQELRKNKELARTLLIALTGYGHAEDREKSNAAGFDAHLVKPSDLVMLRTILNKYKENDC